MNRFFKYSIAMAAAAAAICGCSKQDLESEAAASKACTLTAYLPECGTKTQIGAVDLDNKTTVVNWSENDKISVWGDKNNEFTIFSGVGTNSGAVFNCTNYSGSAQYGLYPYDEYATCDAENEVITTTVPFSQTVAENMYDPSAAIMVGTVDNLVVTFHHAVAYLRITAPDDVTNLESITIETNDGTQLTGDAKFSITDGAFKGKGTYASRFVTIEPSTGSFTAGAIYYAAVVPGNYAYGLTVRYMYKSGTTMVEKSKVSTRALNMEGKQGWTKLIGAANKGLTEETVAEQLYENGPYWATKNIGASSETDYGEYFAWGYATGYTYMNNQWTDADGNTTTFDASGFPDYDTHKYVDASEANWGRGWHDPTSEDFNGLLAKVGNGCEMEYLESKGCLYFTGSIDWQNSSLTLPAASVGYESGFPSATIAGKKYSDPRGKIGWYWVSDGSDASSSGLFMFCVVSAQQMALVMPTSVEGGIKYYGASIRPVHY